MMGVEHYIACKQCKVVRDLDKGIYHLCGLQKNKADMIELSDDIVEEPFRLALLVSFMGKHLLHECVLIGESDLDSAEFGFDPDDPDNDYKWDYDFFNDKESS